MGRNNNQNGNNTDNSELSTTQQNVTDSSDTQNGILNKLKKLMIGKYKIGLVLLVLITLGIIALLCIHLCGGKDDAKKVYRFNKDYILRTDSQKYNVFAGDTVPVLNNCQLLLNGDTICIPNDILEDIVIDEGTVERAPCSIIANEKGTGRLYTYSANADKQNKRMISKKDSVVFKAIDGEIFEISQDKDTINNRPMFILGDHLLWPKYGTSEPKDTVLLTGHEAVIPSKFVLFENTLIVRFEKTDSINSIKILKEYGNDIIRKIKTFGKDVKIPISEKDSIEKRYRIFAKGHVSSLIEPTKAELIEIPSSPTKKDSNWLLWVVSIIAIIEFGVIAAVATKNFLKKRNGKKGIGDNGTIDSDETTKEEKEGLSERKKEFKEYNMPKEENKDSGISSTMNELEKEEVTHGKKPESDEEKIAWINRLIDSQKYENEEFVKQIKRKKKNSDEAEFKKMVLLDFDKSYSKWIQLVNNENNVEFAPDDTTFPQEDEIIKLKNDTNAEEANLGLIEQRPQKLKNEDDTKTKESFENLQKALDEKEKENQDLKDLNNKAEEKIREKELMAKKEIEDVKKQAQEKINEANRRAEEAEQESKKTEERVTTKFKNQITKLEKDIEEKSNSIQDLSSDLSDTRKTLEITVRELKIANETIVAKDNALDRFNKTITDIAPAKEYADKLEKLLKIGEEVEKAATALGQNKNIDDYLVNKYIARYRSTLSTIDMRMLTTDVLNTVKAQFVYKSQMLSTFDQKDKKAFHESMKLYFYDTYLKKYVDALIVLNETMVGMQYLADGATANDVKPFENYRNEINDILKSLEIEVLSVRIMESCADNLMLIVIPKSLDFECPKNSICQIDNCIVYLKGASKPNEKIQVIVKK